MKKVIYIMFVILWHLFIFGQSLLTGDLSSNQSGFIMGIAQDVLAFMHVSIEPELLSYLIRKAAHMFEFFILGLLIYPLYKEKFSENKTYLYIFMHGVFIASLDEFIQTFTDGRAGLLTDVAIDALGILISLAVIKLYNKIKDK